MRVRHLVYHVFPRYGNDGWKWNLDQLKQRWHLFNGKKVIAIAYGRRCHRPAVVQAHLDKDDVEWLVIPNNRDLGEVATFHALMERVETTEPGHAVFRAHAKSVTRPKLPGDRLWAQTMYEVLLDYPSLVREKLAKYPMVSCFKCVDHFPGTFFWFRADTVFARDWRPINQNFFGVEYWPIKVCSDQEMVGIFPSGGNLYGEADWTNHVLPDLQRWREAHKKYREDVHAR